MSLTAKDLTQEEKEQLLIDEELEKCSGSCSRFIRKWVWIEDKDKAGTDTGIPIKFILWPLQLKALAAIVFQRLLIVLKARQLGLTWLVLAYAVWQMLFKPGYTVIALSKTEKDAKELVRRVEFILKHLPAWMTREKKKDNAGFYGPVWTATTEIVTIYHPSKATENGNREEQQPSKFESLTSAPGSGRSLTSNLLILDEWAFQQWATEIWSAAYPTINRPTGGQCIGLSTNKRGSLYEDIWKKASKGLNTFARVFLPWWTDPRRTKEWYEQTKRDLPNSWRQEYPSSPEEALSAGEGTSFPEFTETIHVCRPFKIPSFWRRWRGNDPGYTDPFYWCCYAVSPHGQVFLYREYTRTEKDPKVAYSEQARQFKKMCVHGSEVGQPETGPDGKPIPERFSFTCVGRDAWNREKKDGVPTGKSIVDYYADGGITGCIEPPHEIQTARILRKATWHEYLEPYLDENTGRTTAKLQIFSTCTTIIEALPNLVNDEKDSEKVSLDPHIYTNPYDGGGYGLVAFHSKKSKIPDPEKSDIQRDKEKLAKARAGAGVRTRRRVI